MENQILTPMPRKLPYLPFAKALGHVALRPLYKERAFEPFCASLDTLPSTMTQYRSFSCGLCEDCEPYPSLRGCIFVGGYGQSALVLIQPHSSPCSLLPFLVGSALLSIPAFPALEVFGPFLSFGQSERKFYCQHCPHTSWVCSCFLEQ